MAIKHEDVVIGRLYFFCDAEFATGLRDGNVVVTANEFERITVKRADDGLVFTLRATVMCDALSPVLDDSNTVFGEDTIEIGELAPGATIVNLGEPAFNPAGTEIGYIDPRKDDTEELRQAVQEGIQMLSDQFYAAASEYAEDTPSIPKPIEERFNAVPGYESLAGILLEAYEQAAVGKGHQRHRIANESFEDQTMQTMARYFYGSLLGQAFKKIEESQRLRHDAAVRECLGAINYIAGHIISLRKRQAEIDEAVNNPNTTHPF